VEGRSVNARVDSRFEEGRFPGVWLARDRSVKGLFARGLAGEAH